MFNRSTLQFASAQAQVAAAAGADSQEMLTRAGYSLDAMGKKWNRMRWKFLQTETIIALVAPFTVTGCTVTAGSTTVTTSDTFTNVLVDDVVNGVGLRPDSLVSATASITAFTLNVAASADGTGTFTFKRAFYPLPADYKTIFDARLMGVNKPIFYAPRRLYDREVIDQNSPSEPYGYDLYPVMSKGKIRIVSPPGGVETLWLKYYRRMTLPSSTGANGLDLPEDYEDVFLAGAKVHFLVDKAQTHQSQYMFWQNYYNESLKEMRRDERLVEDEDLTLQPPIPRRVYGPDSPYYRPEWGF